MGIVYPFVFYIVNLIKMQIPLVEGKVPLLYSSWFSDLEFAFLVRGFGHALFDFRMTKGDTVREASV